MDNNPSFVFGKPYCDEFIEIADDVEFKIGDLYIDGKVVSQEPTIEIPQTLTPRQIRLILTSKGLRQQVENLVQESTDYSLKDWWEYSLEYKRDNPLLIQMATALSLTSEDIDNMFIEGSKL